MEARIGLLAAQLTGLRSQIEDLRGAQARLRNAKQAEVSPVTSVVPAAPGYLITPFQVQYKNATTVTVKAGTWERNGIPLPASPADVDKTISANDTYIYLELTATVGDPNVAPDGLSVVASTTKPAEDPGENIYKILAKVSFNGTRITSILRYCAGDIDDQSGGSIAPGDTLYKVFQMVDDGSSGIETGWDWVRAHG